MSAAVAGVIALHAIVTGASIDKVDLVSPSSESRALAWNNLSTTRLEPGKYLLRFVAPAASAIEIPPCAGRAHVTIGANVYTPPPGPFVLNATAAERTVTIEIQVSGYERRVSCGYAPRTGVSSDTREALGVMSFPSPAQGGGKAVVMIPKGHDLKLPSAVLVGLHPWDGSIWTYASYMELLAAAQKRDVVLLFPSGLGNSLYVRSAEEEVMRAIEALSNAVPIDPQRISVFGASMGGAGATTIGFHRPDRFASITSLFGDSKYDVNTYVRSILPTQAAAHLVDCIDLAPAVRHVPVWLVHGEVDRTTPIEQSVMLARELEKLKYTVRFDRVPGAGHESSIIGKNAAEIVERAATMKAPAHPAHVTFASARDEDVEAYGVKLVRAAPGDAFVDIELSGGKVQLQSSRNVREIILGKGALGAAGNEALPPNVRFE